MPIHTAAIYGNADSIKALIEYEKTLVNEINNRVRLN